MKTMKMLKNKTEVEALREAVSKCEGDVILKSMDDTEQYNLKSEISMIIALSKLCAEKGDEYEVFCMNHADEGNMLEFFHELNAEHTAA